MAWHSLDLIRCTTVCTFNPHVSTHNPPRRAHTATTSLLRILCSVQLDDTLVTFSGLRGGKSYSCRITCENVAGIGPFSEFTPFQTLGLLSQAPAPPTLQVRSSQTLQLSWSPISAGPEDSPLTQYVIVAVPMGGSLDEGEDDARYAVLEQLAEAAGVAPADLGAQSTVTSMQDGPDGAESGAGSDDGSDSDEYDDDKIVIATVSPDQTSAVIAGLQPDTEYLVRVGGVNLVGMGPLSTSSNPMHTWGTCCA